jgi:phasin family protein
MNNTTFDPLTLLDTYRKTFAPTAKAQQEGVKVVETFGRYQYAVAGDYLEWTLAQAKAALDAQSPNDFMSRQMELANALGEKMRGRVQEFVALATEAQTTLSQVVSDATSHVVSEAKSKVASATKQAA